MPRDLLAVIGTAGRQDDAPRISRRLYDAMYEHALGAARDWGVTGMVSGGAAVADHLAVRAYLEGRIDRLVLFLPAEFVNGAYREDTQKRGDDGWTANRYHAFFSSACGINSLDELAKAISQGAELHVHNGFKRRNLEVAGAATHMLALTFGAIQAPADMLQSDPGFVDYKAAGLKSGGTAHTWGECWRAKVKRHVSLNWLERELTMEPDTRSQQS